MRIARLGSSLLLTLTLSSCQITYYMKSAWHQAKLLQQRQPLEKVLANPETPDEVKQKLTLAMEVRKFAEAELKLKPTKNYTSYVDLQRPYVSWVVGAAPAYELKHHLWSFPIVGDLPYKGFFSRAEAEAEASTFNQEEFDTYIRGVTAYSTLGWFEDPLLNTMMVYPSHELVNLVIHETVHATIYIKSQADFNERLATFIANKGTEVYYTQREGAQSPTISLIRNEAADEKLFSEFLSRELDELKKWYEGHRPQVTRELKEKRLQEIGSNFETAILPRMKTDQFKHFSRQKFNNAQLLSLKTYVYDLSDFERVFGVFEGNFERFLKFCKSLENEKDPETIVKNFSIPK